MNPNPKKPGLDWPGWAVAHQVLTGFNPPYRSDTAVSERTIWLAVNGHYRVSCSRYSDGVQVFRAERLGQFGWEKLSNSPTLEMAVEIANTDSQRQHPPPEVYFGPMPANVYHSGPMSYLLSSGALRTLDGPEGPRTFQAKFVDHTLPRKESDFMSFGNAAHVLALEPDEAPELVVEIPKSLKERRGEEWDKFVAWHRGKVMLRPSDYRRAHNAAAGAAKVLAEMPQLGKVYNEHTILWQERGLWMKARPDRCQVVNEGDQVIQVELKFTESIDERKFRRKIENFGYLMQQAHYAAGVLRVVCGIEDPPEYIDIGELYDKLACFIVAVRDQPPHLARTFRITPETMHGELQRRSALLDEMVYRRDANDWSNPGEEEIVDL